MTPEDMERILDEGLKAATGIGPEWREELAFSFGGRDRCRNLSPVARCRALAEVRRLADLGYKHDAIAAEIGVSQSTVSRWLRA